MPLRKTPRNAGPKKKAAVRSSNIKEFLAANPKGKSKKPMAKKAAVKQAVAVAFANQDKGTTAKSTKKNPAKMYAMKSMTLGRGKKPKKAAMPKAKGLAKASKSMNKAAHRRPRNSGRS